MAFVFGDFDGAPRAMHPRRAVRRRIVRRPPPPQGLEGFFSDVWDAITGVVSGAGNIVSGGAAMVAKPLSSLTRPVMQATSILPSPIRAPAQTAATTVASAGSGGTIQMTASGDLSAHPLAPIQAVVSAPAAVVGVVQHPTDASSLQQLVSLSSGGSPLQSPGAFASPDAPMISLTQEALQTTPGQYLDQDIMGGALSTRLQAQATVEKLKAGEPTTLEERQQAASFYGKTAVAAAGSAATSEDGLPTAESAGAISEDDLIEAMQRRAMEIAEGKAKELLEAQLMAMMNKYMPGTAPAPVTPGAPVEVAPSGGYARALPAVTPKFPILPALGVILAGYVAYRLVKR